MLISVKAELSVVDDLIATGFRHGGAEYGLIRGMPAGICSELQSIQCR